MTKDKHSFLHRIFFGNGAGTERERKVFEYVCHRVGGGVHVRDVMQEEYARRNASPEDARRLLFRSPRPEAFSEHRPVDWHRNGL